jgi:hypothetical protein
LKLPLSLLATAKEYTEVNERTSASKGIAKRHTEKLARQQDGLSHHSTFALIRTLLGQKRPPIGRLVAHPWRASNPSIRSS